MRTTWIICLLVLCLHEVIGSTRARKDNTSSFGLGQFDVSGSSQDDARLAHLTDSIEGLFDTKPQQSAPKPSVASPSKTASHSSQAQAKAGADLKTAETDAKRAKRDAEVLAARAAHAAEVSKTLSQKNQQAHKGAHVTPTAQKLSARAATKTQKPTAAPTTRRTGTTKDASTAPRRTVKAPVHEHHMPATITAVDSTATQNAPATEHTKVSASSRPQAAHGKLANSDRSTANAHKLSKSKTNVNSKPSSNTIVDEAISNKSTSARKMKPAVSKSAKESSGKNSRQNHLSSQSGANMSSVAEGAKSSLKSKNQAVGTFAVDPASNPLHNNASNPLNNNASKATRNATVIVDPEVVHELPWSKLALGDDDDANAAKSKSNRTSNQSTQIGNISKASMHIGNVTAANNPQWQEREKYLETEIARLKHKLQKQAPEKEREPEPPSTSDKPAVIGSKSTAVHPSKKVKSAIETNAAVFTASDASNSIVPEPLVSFNIGEGGSALPFRTKPFAVGTFTDAPTESVADSNLAPSEPMSFWRWISSFFGGAASPEPALRGSPSTIVQAVPPKASLLTVESQGVKQNAERTAEATAEDSMQSVALADSWNQLEKQDKSQEDVLHHQDAVARIVAKRTQAPHTPTKAEMESRHQTDISSFWSSLEQEDANIEKSLTENGENLDKYERLTQDQNQRVGRAAANLEQDKLNLDHVQLKKGDLATTPIHDVFEQLEKHDQKTAAQIKANPDLQMLQLQHERKHA